MELTALTELFSNVGFPIAFIVVLIFVIYLMGKRMNERADKNMERVQERCKEREERLYEEIAENRRVNEKAIDTIGQYASKLDNIQSDVKEIKQDLSLIMMNGGHYNDH
jgi:Na+-transporting methylmalonyl-CoA/oxaloacetate decarboxylase gamma subunit